MTVSSNLGCGTVGGLWFLFHPVAFTAIVGVPLLLARRIDMSILNIGIDKAGNI